MAIAAPATSPVIKIFIIISRYVRMALRPAALMPLAPKSSIIPVTPQRTVDFCIICTCQSVSPPSSTRSDQPMRSLSIASIVIAGQFDVHVKRRHSGGPPVLMKKKSST
ncbi:MAG: hypothetical protein HEQ16_12030 [Bosea sp.]|nr:hypothetical protein [Bosea sp. (in: a-proteobacteria)]